MTELAGNLEEKEHSSLKRFFEWIGGGLAVAQAAEVGYVDDQNTGDILEVLSFETSESIRTPAELDMFLDPEEAR
jgi:hypothetical protein